MSKKKSVPDQQKQRKKQKQKQTRRRPTPETREKIRQALLERGRLVRAGLLPSFHHTEKTKRHLSRIAKGRKPSRKAIEASIAARKDKKAARIAANIK